VKYQEEGKEVVASLPRRERTKIEARARVFIAEEMSLRDLRKAIGKTQATVARRLAVGQEAVSRLEMRADMHLSALRNMLEAIGGRAGADRALPQPGAGTADHAGDSTPPAQDGAPRGGLEALLELAQSSRLAI
jgi:transcriptional regulator with XRE-family HTH domain